MNQVLDPRIGGKTVVVLLGWLGAQPKSLRRYETLYRTLLQPPLPHRDRSSSSSHVTASTTTAVIQTYIAPPFTIVQSVLGDEPICVPFDWPQNHSYCRNIRTVQDLAWNILQDIHNNIHHNVSSSNHIYIHAFSNGGCFVWEKIRQILLLAQYDTDDNQRDNGAVNQESRNISCETTDPISLVPSIKVSDAQSIMLFQIRQQLRGVVFDSCPISDLHRLPEALQYCTIAERIQVLRFCHYKYLSINIDPNVKKQVQKRITNYVTGLQNDPLNIKQLYLYSRDDPLAPSSFIDDLVQCRRRRILQLGKRSQNHRNADIEDKQIMSCVWDKSQHCGHYLHHPKEYTNAIETLLMTNPRGDGNHSTTNDCKRNTLRSKL